MLEKRCPAEVRLMSRPPVRISEANPVHQDKVAQMIGAELRFKAVRGMAKRCVHHSRIRDHHVEGLTLRQQRIGACSHALKTGESERNQLQAAAVYRSPLLDLCGRRFRLYQIPRRTHDKRAVRGKRPRSLNSDPSRNAGNENPFPAQTGPDKTSSVVDVAPNTFTILFLFIPVRS
jgi:hypothetical protein